ELDVVQPPLVPGGELLLDCLADLADGRLRQRCLWSQRNRQRAFDIANRQAADEPGDDQRLQRVGAGYAPAKESGGERLARATQLGPCQGDGPGGGLDGQFGVAVAVAGPGGLAAGAGGPARGSGGVPL